MKTRFSFSFSTDDLADSSTMSLGKLLDDTASQVLKLKENWRLEYLGFMLIINRYTDESFRCFKPRRPRFEETFILKNPLFGDKTMNGFCSIEHRFSIESYQELIHGFPNDSSLLIQEIETMVGKTKFLEKKIEGFSHSEFQKVFVNAFKSLLLTWSHP